MRNTRKGILLLFAVSLVGIFSALAGTAVAAGLPEIESIKTVNTNIVEAKSEAWVNPNGASTTFKAEYRQPGAKTWVSGPTVNVGSGTEWLITSGNMRLKPKTTYEVRISATNSFGTTQEVATKSFSSATWSIESGVGSSAVASGEGTWKLEVRQGANWQTVECLMESGSGTIGHAEGVGDGFTYKVGNCSYYLNGKFICHPKAEPFNGSMDGSFLGTATGKFNWCPGEEGSVNTFSISSYTVKMSKQAELLKVQPITLTATATIDSYITGTVTINTNWSLSGEHAGLKFSVGNL
jgi:hypothetical protein